MIQQTSPIMWTHKNNNVCNNCGKHGHLFYQCGLPITSCGIIAFTQPTDLSESLRFLMIRRKDSFGYIDFIRGKYSLKNVDQIQKMIDEMSIPEKRRILKEPYETLCKLMWGGRNVQYKNEEFLSQKKFDSLKSGLVIGDEMVSLQTLVETSQTAWEETEWEFPKGRRNYQEKDIECALREFSEETGYSCSNIDLIDNLQPFEEIFIGSNYKAYKHKYYLAKLRRPVTNANAECLKNYQITEVSEIMWKTCDECLQIIRPYNIEKKQMISSVNDILTEFCVL